MKRKLTVLSILISVVLLCIAILIFNGRTDPQSARHAQARNTIENFYNAYKQDIGYTTPYLTTSPAYLANYRFYYGDIQDYTIESIKDSGSGRKIASVKVRTKKQDGIDVAYTDTLQLEQVDGKWLISKYITNSTEDWPALP